MQIDVKEDKLGFLIPFYMSDLQNIQRFFIIKNKKINDVRGNHAHKRDSQILILLNGACEIEYENREENGKHIMKFGVPYCSKPYEWLRINMLQPDTVILVLCSEEYEEQEYIRDYKQFLEFIK